MDFFIGVTLDAMLVNNLLSHFSPPESNFILPYLRASSGLAAGSAEQSRFISEAQYFKSAASTNSATQRFQSLF